MHIIGIIFLGICIAFFLSRFALSIDISESGTEYQEEAKKSRRASIDGEIIDVEPIDDDDDK